MIMGGGRVAFAVRSRPGASARVTTDVRNAVP